MVWSKKLKNKNTAICLILLVFGLFVVSGCNKSEETIAKEKTTQEESETTAKDINSIDVSSLKTKEDFKNTIASLSNEGEELILKSKIYDAYYKKYEFEESEYIEYANICGMIGETKKQRELLWMLYRLDPTKEHGELISESVYVVDGSSDQAGLVRKIYDGFANFESEELELGYIKEILASEEWRNSFFLDTGIYTSHTRVEGDFKADIYSDQVENLIIFYIDGRRIGVKSTAIGSVVFSTGVEEDGYSGDFKIIEYDELDNVIITREGTIENEHLVNKLSITIDGIQYVGNFDSDGHTTEEQREDVEGVIYAYDVDANYYLYIADVDASTWVADSGFINLEETEH